MAAATPTLSDPHDQLHHFNSSTPLLKHPLPSEPESEPELESGLLRVRVMKPEEMDMIVALLAESLPKSICLPSAFVSLLVLS
ncbi:hypothetical protein PanWU01x14_368020 [Parasponia andersonii]|uniref:Uncharacterized protein n=1 Tax=Parasponia andersonii TaxID=3476 RepID=A0A2P5A547_PARAD|nr:hypothetical protein PanWU01x14_368020 [Parasponia andersonii]